MNYRNYIYTFILLAIMGIFVFSLQKNKNSENILSYASSTDNYSLEKISTSTLQSPVIIVGPKDPIPDLHCPKGQVQIALMGLKEKKSWCGPVNDGDGGEYFFGTGKETYEITGYYKQHIYDFYPIEYDPKRDLGYPTKYTCDGFVMTNGSSDFIDAYSKKIKLRIDDYPVIDLNFVHPAYTNSPQDSGLEKLPQIIYDTTPENQFTMKINLGPLPGRDANPCENYAGVRYLGTP